MSPTDCENLKFQDNPTGATSFPYEQERGNVPFYITDLPNQARWAEVDAWGLPSLDKVISNLMAKVGGWATARTSPQDGGSVDVHDMRGGGRR
jgi:hypothetical protein